MTRDRPWPARSPIQIAMSTTPGRAQHEHAIRLVSRPGGGEGELSGALRAWEFCWPVCAIHSSGVCGLVVPMACGKGHSRG